MSKIEATIERLELRLHRAAVAFGLARRMGSLTPQHDEEVAERTFRTVANAYVDVLILAGEIDLEELRAAAARDHASKQAKKQGG